MANSKNTIATAAFTALTAGAGVASAQPVVPFRAIVEVLAPVNVYPDMLFTGQRGNGRTDVALKNGMIESLGRRYQQCVGTNHQLNGAYQQTGCVFGGGVAMQTGNNITTFMQALVKIDPSGEAEVLVRQRIIGRTQGSTKTDQVQYVGAVFDQLEEQSPFKRDYYTGNGNLHITYAFKIAADGKSVPLDHHKVNLVPYGYLPVPDVEMNIKTIPASHDIHAPFTAAKPVFQPLGAMEIDQAAGRKPMEQNKPFVLKHRKPGT